MKKKKTSTRPSNCAREAAAIVQERGHCKEDYVDAEGRVCILGAITAACKGNMEYEDLIENTVGMLLGMEPMLMNVGSWNDQPEIGQQQVVNILIGAAVSLQMRGM